MLRHARRRVHDWVRAVGPQRATLKTDALAGLPGAIGSVPDGMAASVLTGVNPVHGLYASFAGPVAGGLTASTKLMVITTTGAAALAAGSALEDLTPAERPGALFLLTLIAGAAMIAAGLLRLGRFTRFVSHSVMIGFLSGVAVNIIAGQIADVTGAQAEGSIALQKAWDVIIHPSRIDPASLLAGAAALAIIVLLGRTRIAAFSAVVALAVPTVAVILAGADVAQVEDQGDIPAVCPCRRGPSCPHSRCRCSPGRWRSRRSCSCRESASPSPPRTMMAHDPTPTSISSPRASATSARGSSRVNPSGVRSVRRR